MIRILNCVALAVILATAVRAQGWQGKEGEPLPPQREQLNEADQARYDAMAIHLVERLNARDAEGVRDSFSDEGWESAIDWWKQLFAVQYEKFGSIHKAWAPRRGVVPAGKIGVQGEEREGASFLVHFEEPCGMVLSFELDEHDKIVHSSVWAHQSLGEVEPEGVQAIFEAD